MQKRHKSPFSTSFVKWNSPRLYCTGIHFFLSKLKKYHIGDQSLVLSDYLYIYQRRVMLLWKVFIIFWVLFLFLSLCSENWESFISMLDFLHLSYRLLEDHVSQRYLSFFSYDLFSYNIPSISSDIFINWIF